MNGHYCEDMIIGGAEYIKDGVFKFNTIPLLNTFYEDGDKYKLSAGVIYTGDSRGCDECGANEKWIMGRISDPLINQSFEIFIRRITYNGQEAIKIFILIDIALRTVTNEDAPPPINLPTSEDIILIKQ